MGKDNIEVIDDRTKRLHNTDIHNIVGKEIKSVDVTLHDFLGKTIYVKIETSEGTLTIDMPYHGSKARWQA